MIYNLPHKQEFPYLTFSSPNTFAIDALDWSGAPAWEGVMYYSNDALSWRVWDGKNVESAFLDDKYVLYLRGVGNTKVTNFKSWTFTGADIACEGNIETLLDCKIVKQGKHPVMGGYCYGSMFKDCTALTTAPELPATTLVYGCYNSMFYGCTNLTVAPQLPATTLAGDCYNFMFEDCTALTTAPELPATTLKDLCYQCMFQGCTSLTTAPELPARTLASNCYHGMFQGCTSLTTAPELPATTLAIDCYCGMFRGCIGLTAAPKLPATTLAAYCYQGMFENCTNLTTAPELPATTLVYSCYNSMFDGCVKLTSIPALPALQLAAKCYMSMFDGCSKLCIYSAADTSRNEYRIPVSGTGTTAEDAMTDMFTGTGGNVTGTPSINTTYYTTNEIVGGTNKITTANIGNYFTVTNGSSYYFVGSYIAATGYTFTSNNNGVNSSTATTTLTALKTMFVSFGYSYSSEANYDKFTLKIGDVTVENGVSGSLTQKTWSGVVKKGEVISFTYAKDSSQHKNDDQCKFYGMTVKEEKAITVSTFIINNTTYSFEEGMTWQDWVNSSYNTDGYIIGSVSGYGSNILCGSDELYAVVTRKGHNTQSATDSPQAGVEYYED